ncbi:TIGR04283 family arsenosugar biosynthesis glycosyltransferase [Maribacter algicola]|uniref:TIGR04283 family arsenosugar biosynthesis glycosyltransferase n=1 Tax=Meishania litoralis TaxID=3434685 RepID=A0ACC7LM61_9FLAO
MVSIIIPAHNEKKNLERLLGYLEKSNIKNAEVIVAFSEATDDGQIDVRKPSFANFLRCKGQGRAFQMNSGANAAKGGILVFLHADVIPPETFLTDIANVMNKGYDAGFFSYRFDSNSLLLKINALFTARDGFFTGGGDQCLFIKKPVFERLGRFDENQIVMEDFEFFQRMKKHKVRYTIIKNDLIVSARKYLHNSYIRVNLSNLLLVILFKFGYPPHKLKSLYGKLIRTPYQNPS